MNVNKPANKQDDAQVKKPVKRPNIIVYFSDQQRWDTLGCYGQKLDVTPCLDKIAAEGVRFENAFTCQPVCGPARASLQTGLYATETGCYRNGIALSPDADTIAKRLGAAGYDTAYVGKWHLASGDSVNDGAGANDFQTVAVPPERRGGYKDYWMASDVLEFTSHGYNGYVHDGAGARVEFTGYRADCINNYAVDYIRNHDGDNPFFLFISQIEPHHQNDHNRFEGPDGSKRRFRDYEIPGDLAGTSGDWRENFPDYLGCCASLDYNVGRLFDTLRDRGVADETVFIYTSDHGSHFRTRNDEYKRACHDGCVRIPMIARGPGFTGGNVIDRMVSLIDIPATVLDCAGVGTPDGYRGRPLGKLAADPGMEWEDCVFIQISESQVGRCVRTPKWKYSVRADADGWRERDARVYYEDFLYDLEADPHERVNLINDPDYADTRGRMAALLAQKMLEAGEPTPEILPHII